MLLTDTPKNSTQVEDTSPVDSHHNLELSQIAPPPPYAVHEQADPASVVDQVHHMDVPTTLDFNCTMIAPAWFPVGFASNSTRILMV